MGGLWLASDLVSDVIAGKKQMFCLNDSIAVTQISLYPRAKVLEVIVAVGDLDELRELHEKLLEFAAEVGATVVQAYGRRGWIPDAAKRGWKVKARSFTYQLEM
jgi:vacuolar-type H+-ATPase subunit B/Vma2